MTGDDIALCKINYPDVVYRSTYATNNLPDMQFPKENATQNAGTRNPTGSQDGR